MSHLLNRKVLVVIPCYLFQENTIIFEELKNFRKIVTNLITPLIHMYETATKHDISTCLPFWINTCVNVGMHEYMFITLIPFISSRLRLELKSYRGIARIEKYAHLPVAFGFVISALWCVITWMLIIFQIFPRKYSMLVMDVSSLYKWPAILTSRAVENVSGWNHSGFVRH